eukprot:6201493-Pleurochrysis_carterae.AAC.1
MRAPALPQLHALAASRPAFRIAVRAPPHPPHTPAVALRSHMHVSALYPTQHNRAPGAGHAMPRNATQCHAVA